MILSQHNENRKVSIAIGKHRTYLASMMKLNPEKYEFMMSFDEDKYTSITTYMRMLDVVKTAATNIYETLSDLRQFSPYTTYLGIPNISNNFLSRLYGGRVTFMPLDYMEKLMLIASGYEAYRKYHDLPRYYKQEELEEKLYELSKTSSKPWVKSLQYTEK